jgi:magnesium chelatase family protein
MLSKTRSAAILALDVFLIDVEVDIARGLPSFTIVGLPDASINESKDRVRSAVKNSGFDFPSHRITVNLAPADLRKEGPAFDLPVALGVLSATEQLEPELLKDFLAVGELSLDGAVRPVRGMLPIALAARENGVSSLILPSENMAEARLVEGLTLFPAESLGQVVRDLAGGVRGETASGPAKLEDSEPSCEVDFSEVKGQESAKRALEIAAAGNHNVFMIGPPGSGKTMLARRLPTILPPLTIGEALEVTRLYSVSGLLRKDSPLVNERPFRAPHHTSSSSGLLGGGTSLRLGEVSLAHMGVLFLDEVPEFHRDVLESLRQPLEDGLITISRSAFTATVPSVFLLVAAMNPCPCGNRGDSARECTCHPQQVRRYLTKMSAPLMDRIDLHLEVPRLKPGELSSRAEGEPSRSIRQRVVEARERQNSRFKNSRTRTNSRMTAREIRHYCSVGPETEELLRAAVSRLGLSARAYSRILKMARTISDLAGRDSITAGDVAEAIQYRSLDRSAL